MRLWGVIEASVEEGGKREGVWCGRREGIWEDGGGWCGRRKGVVWEEGGVWREGVVWEEGGSAVWEEKFSYKS